MDKAPTAASFIFLCLSITIGEGQQQETSTFWERLRSTHSAPSTVSSTYAVTTGQWCMNMIKRLIDQTHGRFFPPNLDFRRGEEADAITEGGAGEKLKEALAKSSVNSKTTIEVSAKSAARIAAETLQKTTETVKKSLSSLKRKRGHQIQKHL